MVVRVGALPVRPGDQHDLAEDLRVRRAAGRGQAHRRPAENARRDLPDFVLLRPDLGVK